MSDAYTGEIRMFGGTFAPLHWAFCDGNLLAIVGNEQLYSLIGTTYGGDGRSTFALPDFRGRAAVHQNPQNVPTGISPAVVGQRAGMEGVALDVNEMPSHSHALTVINGAASSNDPTNKMLAVPDGNDKLYITDPDPSQMVTMPSTTAENTGQGAQHENMAPYVVLNYIICLQGLYPQRN